MTYISMFNSGRVGRLNLCKASDEIAHHILMAGRVGAVSVSLEHERSDELISNLCY